jgi:hypothetical protein
MVRALLLASLGVGLLVTGGCVDGKTPDCSTPSSGCFPGDAGPQPDASDGGDASPANDAASDANADSSTDAPVD